MILRTTDEHLLPSSIVLCNSKIKSKIKTRGSRPPTAPYSFTGLKEYAEKGLRCAKHVWLVRTATSNQVLLIKREPALPPQDPRLLRASPVVKVFKGCNVLLAFPLQVTQQGQAR